MQLKFRHRHLSIVGFPTIDIPPLTIVLGINGSGKTHLLQAIQNGAIENSVSPTSNRGRVPMDANGGPIRLLSNTNSAPLPGMNGGPIANTTYSTPHQMAGNSSGHIEFDQSRSTALSTHISTLEKALGQPLSSILYNKEDPWRLGAEELISRAGRGADSAETARVFADAAEALRQRVPTVVANKLGKTIFDTTHDDLAQFQPWQTDQFHFDLPTLFGRYRDRYLRNQLQRLKDDEQGTKNALTKEAFLAAFGRPPWVSLNETLSLFGLPYAASTPETNDYSQVSFDLRKINSGEQVHPNNLSSGERVLLQFAISSYNVDDGITNITRPQILLLDELDAPLHPEMVHRWLGAISGGLVDSQGVHCILTTHAPTTVALAPETALYEMIDGASGLRKVSKQEALNKLTFGLPTLSIDYLGRRQVFTESDTDATMYERVYSLIKSDLSCERELNFLSTGMRKKDGGEINSGCTIVKRIVKDLYEAGNNAVYGIIDWDGEAISGDRVRVISEGLRDGIENILLDPLLVCLLLMKHRRAPLGLDDIDRFVGASSLSPTDLQRMADAVQHATFPSSTSEKVEVEFIGGARTRVLREYLTTDDHQLETLLVLAFPALGKWRDGGRGRLVGGVVDEVLTEHRSFCPMDLKSVFESIANAPI